MGITDPWPAALPAVPSLIAAALIVSVFVAKRVVPSRHGGVDTRIYAIVAAGMLAARLAFVARHWDLYHQTPLAIIDIRDGGFSRLTGLAVAIGAALWYLWRSGPRRRALLLSLSAGACTALLGGSAVWMLRQPHTDIGLPTMTLAALDGAPVRFDAFRGKPVVINLWASWCPPCRHEMPVLQHAQASNGNVVFVFADQGEDAETVRHYLAAENIDVDNVVLDTAREVARHAGSRALPTTLFFDADGRLQQARVGELSSASLAERLAALQPGGAD